MKKILVIALICAITLLPFTGCGQSEEGSLSDDIKVPRTSKQGESVEKAEEVVKIRVLGTETNDAYSVLLTNQTGQDIIDLRVGTDTSITEASNLLEGSEAYADNEQVELFYTAPVSEDNGGNEKELTPEYQVALILADGSQHTLHAFPFDDIAEGVIKTQEAGITYLSYISTSTGEEVETLDAEKAIIDQSREEAERAAAAAEAEAAAAAEAAKQAATESQSETPESSSSSESSSDSKSNAVNSGNSSSSGQGSNNTSSSNNGSSSSSSSSYSGNKATGGNSSSSSGSGNSSNTSGSSSGSGSSSVSTTTDNRSSSAGSESSGSSASTDTSTSGNSSSSGSGSSGGTSSGGASSGSTGSSSGGSSGSTSSGGSGASDDGCVGDGLTY